MNQIQLNLSDDARIYLKGYCLDTDEVTAQMSYPTVLLVPGGGFKAIRETEMDRMCLAFANAGYQAFYLRYHLLGEIQGALMPTPLYDLGVAVKLLRSKEKDLHMNGDLTLVGLSIGGSIVSQYNGRYMEESYLKEVGMTVEEAKPSRIVLCYPVTAYDKGFPKTAEAQAAMVSDVAQNDSSHYVNAASRPTFLWTTWEDNVLDLSNSLDYIQALKQHQIPTEVHIFDHGAHGLGLADLRTTLDEDQHVAHWFRLCLEWMKRN